MDPLTRKDRNTLYTAARAAAKGGALRADSAEIDALANEIVFAWWQVNKETWVFTGGQYGSTLANGMLNVARKENLFPTEQERGIREVGDALAVAEAQGAQVQDETEEELFPQAGTFIERLERGTDQDELFALIFRLHLGERIFRRQPARLSQLARTEGIPGLRGGKLAPRAEIDLVLFHQFGAQRGPCPTCNLIATKVVRGAGLGQAQVEGIIDSLLIHMKEERV
jgi:hypothetical protein